MTDLAEVTWTWRRIILALSQATDCLLQVSQLSNQILQGRNAESSGGLEIVLDQ